MFIRRTLIGLVAAVAAAAPASASAPRRPPATLPVVPSLEPAATAKLHRQLVARGPLRVDQECRGLRGIFYAQTDWLRLATKLAAAVSPCAQYYVSVPPVLGDKTQLRADQAGKIRALGPNFHAMAEIHYGAWTKWVAAGNGSWFDAGVTARKRMAAAGFDVTKGDVWAVNELSSAVRRGDGAARTNARELLRGLYEGDGGPKVRGAVFVIGIGQRLGDVSLYQMNVQNWLPDAPFWTDLATYVSDWSQETYPDVRSWAVPGASPQQRRDYLNQFLQHQLLLASAGPPTIDAARAFLQSTYSPLANAAWAWGSAYGWTLVPVDVMQSFVSSQVYALRSFSIASGQPQDHWGFAWAPRNSLALPPADFATQTGAILDRLAAAIRDSAAPADPNDAAIGACGTPGGAFWCGGDVEGAAFTNAWQAMQTWTQPVLAFSTPSQALTAGAPSAPAQITLISPAGVPQAAPAPVPVALTSSSATGQLSTSPTGPWTPTLTVTIPAGGSASEPFYYQDTKAGAPELRAPSAGYTTAYQGETVAPGPPANVALTPQSATLKPHAAIDFDTTTTDAFGNAVETKPAWAVQPPTLGTITPDGKFAAGFRGGTGSVTASVAGANGATVTGTAKITVEPGKLRIGSIRYGIGRGRLLLTARTITGGGRPIGGVRVSILVRRNGYRYFTGSTTSGPSGRAIFALRPTRTGCFAAVVTKAATPGLVWDRHTPRNRFCK